MFYLDGGSTNNLGFVSNWQDTTLFAVKRRMAVGGMAGMAVGGWALAPNVFAGIFTWKTGRLEDEKAGDW
jgi:hypothetical protein